jgi:Holliday junction resolvasome RuvABC endonuclease subunit
MKGSVKKRRDSGLGQRLQDLREQIDIVLPEMTARIAALEHLLREKQLCPRQDLIAARQFVRMQEA